MITANVNDRIEWLSIVPKERKKGIIERGTVLKLYDNSVLVAIDGSDHKRTVINHRNYKLIEAGEVTPAESPKKRNYFNPNNKLAKAKAKERSGKDA